jgi:hypothetical protein
LTRQEEAQILARAYVPEHIVSLMRLLSEGDPFLIEDYLGLAKDDWLMIIGYPLEKPFSQERYDHVLNRAVEAYRPQRLWTIGPEAPASDSVPWTERETDQYYIFEMERTAPSAALCREVRKASEKLVIERGQSWTEEHHALTTEFLGRVAVPERVRGLYLAMPQVIGPSPSAWTIDARDKVGALCAFSVLDLGARQFSAYILGAHSKENYIPHASDLLFFEMIRFSREQGKSAINLGLWVNEGIGRFKKKWGGRPFLKYEFRGRRCGVKKGFWLLDALLGQWKGNKPG